MGDCATKAHIQAYQQPPVRVASSQAPPQLTIVKKPPHRSSDIVTVRKK
jgi:hypothetical protein